MDQMPVTLTFVALYAIALVPMTGWIGLYRSKIGALRGDGGDAVLFKRIRVHGNLTENAPAFALVLAAAEWSGLAQPWLWGAVACFVVGRMLYVRLFDSAQRWLAMVFTQFPAALMGLWVLASVWLAG